MNHWMHQEIKNLKKLKTMVEKKRKKRSDADVTDYAYESVVGGAGSNDWSFILKNFSQGFYREIQCIDSQLFYSK